MSMFLDSADLAQARAAFGAGLVQGVTTNPALMGATGRPALEVLGELCEVAGACPVFFQLQGDSLEARRDEAWQAMAVHPWVGLKIPCTGENLALAAELAGEGHPVGITAIFSPAQVMLACAAGADYVLPYVNRSTRLLGDGLTLVREMRAVIDACGAATQICAASLKTPQEAVDTLLAGAHHLTLPPALLRAMGEHELSRATIAEFAEISQK